MTGNSIYRYRANSILYSRCPSASSSTCGCAGAVGSGAPYLLASNRVLITVLRCSSCLSPLASSLRRCSPRPGGRSGKLPTGGDRSACGVTGARARGRGAPRLRGGAAPERGGGNICPSHHGRRGKRRIAGKRDFRPAVPGCICWKDSLIACNHSGCRLLYPYSPLPYCSSVKVFAGKVWTTGFFQKAGFPQKLFMTFVGYCCADSCACQ